MVIPSFAIAQSHIDQFLPGPILSPADDVIVVLAPLDTEQGDVSILDDGERARAAGSFTTHCAAGLSPLTSPFGASSACA